MEVEMNNKKWLAIGGVLLLCLLSTWGNVHTGNAQAVSQLYLPMISNGQARVPINFSPYIDGQDPNTGVTIPESQIRERLRLISPYTSWVRTFSCGNGIEATGRIARELGLKVAVTAWIGKDLTANQQQVNCLIAEANAGRVDLAIVGSEAILRNDVSLDTLMGYIDQVQAAVPEAVPVTNADVYTIFLDHPELVNHIDLIFANLYPFWEGYDVTYGVAMVNYMYGSLSGAFPEKEIRISETGWPDCGSFGDAIGTPDNAALYFNQVESWAEDRHIALFYFEAFDESWKTAYEGAAGACWGIFNKSGVMKNGMATFFNGRHTAYDLSLPLTCDTDAFSFAFTYVPPIGSHDNLTGRVCGVFSKDKKILTYIKVGDSWWVKPYQNAPTVAVNLDGSFSVDYTTGGTDHLATEIKLYLLPADADPYGDLSTYPMIHTVRTP